MTDASPPRRRIPLPPPPLPGADPSPSQAASGAVATAHTPHVPPIPQRELSGAESAGRTEGGTPAAYPRPTIAERDGALRPLADRIAEEVAAQRAATRQAEADARHRPREDAPDSRVRRGPRGPYTLVPSTAAEKKRMARVRFGLPATEIVVRAVARFGTVPLTLLTRVAPRIGGATSEGELYRAARVLRLHGVIQVDTPGAVGQRWKVAGTQTLVHAGPRWQSAVDALGVESWPPGGLAFGAIDEAVERAAVFGECLRLALSGWRVLEADEWLEAAVAWPRENPFLGRGAEITKLRDRGVLTLRPLAESGAGNGETPWVVGLLPPREAAGGAIMATPYDAVSREFGSVGGVDTARATRPVLLAAGTAGYAALWTDRAPALRVAAPFTVLTYHRSVAHMSRVREWIAAGPERIAPCPVHTVPSRHQWSRYREFWTAVSDAFGTCPASRDQARALVALIGLGRTRDRGSEA